MPNYVQPNTQGNALGALTSSFTTLVCITAATSGLKRFKTYDFLVGAISNPNATDTYIDYDYSIATSTGTSAIVSTPRPIDPADGVSSAVSTTNCSAEPTITASSSLWNLAINQRASFRWVAKDGGELVAPATNVNGHAIRAKSATYTGNATCTWYFTE